MRIFCQFFRSWSLSKRLRHFFVISFIILFILSSGIIWKWYTYKPQYGFNSSDGHYLYSYFVTEAELAVKNKTDFEQQFKSQAYQELVAALQKIADDSDLYLQSESFFLPIIQKIYSSTKTVFVFETTTRSFDGSKTKRLAFECEQLKETLSFPEDCYGYYMIDAWEWPPNIMDISEGSVKFDPIPFSRLPVGCLSGVLDISLNDQMFDQKRQLSGKFCVLDKQRHLFFSLPVGYK